MPRIQYFEVGDDVPTKTGNRFGMSRVMMFAGAAALCTAALVFHPEIPHADFVHEPQIPPIPPDPDQPYRDRYGRIILYPIKPNGISEYDTTMIGEDGSNLPPKNSPDALELRKKDPVKFHDLYYGGATRSEIAKADNALYKRLLRIEREVGYDIMLRNKPYGDEPLTRWETLYKPRGLTRGQLYKVDPQYYNYLNYHDLLGPIPLAPPAYGDDPIADTNEKWPGLTRGKLEEVDPARYAFLRRTLGPDGRPLIEQIPVQLPGEHDPYGHYLKEHPGLTAKELKVVDPKNYWQLRRWGLIHLLPK